MKSLTKRDDQSGPDSGARQRGLRWHGKEHQQAPAITIAPARILTPAIHLSPQLSQGNANLSNIIVAQDTGSRSASIMAFAGLSRTITSSSARAARVAAQTSPLPPPLSSHHTHPPASPLSPTLEQHSPALPVRRQGVHAFTPNAACPGLTAALVWTHWTGGD